MSVVVNKQLLNKCIKRIHSNFSAALYLLTSYIYNLRPSENKVLQNATTGLILRLLACPIIEGNVSIH